jgi:hypothetical protein
MTSYEPASPTLAGIAAGDIINYQGTSDTVESVSSVTKHTGGTITVVVVLTTSGATLTLTTADTILSSYHINQAGVSQATWSQTASYT